MADKGPNFERDACKRLSLWWSGEKTDSIFWRTSNSGGRATIRAKRGLETPNSYGDVGALDPNGDPLIDLVCIELKRGYSEQLTIQNLLDSNQAKPLLLKFWKKAEQDRVLGKRRWCWLIFQRDRMRACIVFNQSFWNFLTSYAGKLKYSKDFRLLVKIGCVFEKTHYNLYVLRLSEFLHWIDPEIFKAYIKEIKR